MKSVCDYIMMFCYHLAWTCAFVLAAPFIPLLKKTRIADRLTFNLPPICLKGRTIWVHALSVGEVISAIPLIDGLKSRFPDKDIILTTTTSRGMIIARKELGAKVKAILTSPFDFFWSIRRFVNDVNPLAFILVETDIWPAQIHYLQKKGVITALVNGRVSPRTFKSYRRFSWFTKTIFRDLGLCLMQSELDSGRLRKILTDPEKVITVGNIKFDRKWIPIGSEERRELLNIIRFRAEDPIWVAGSTHPGEEKILLDVFKRLLPSFESLRMIIAPRDINRSNEILDVAARMDLRAVLRSALEKQDTGLNEVVVLDTIGELVRFYGLARVSFVGGSLVPEGGHNLLEPASSSVPVLFGPHMYNFVQMSESLEKAGGGKRVDNDKELYDSLKNLLTDEQACKLMGERAKAFVDSNRGALDRALALICDQI